MPVARSTAETFDYVTLADRELPKEQQTVFHLRRLPTNVHVQLMDLTTAAHVALRAGLAGWTNFRDENGEEIPFKIDPRPEALYGLPLKATASLATINRLAPADAMEIATTVLKGNELTKTDVKN